MGAIIQCGAGQTREAGKRKKGRGMKSRQQPSRCELKCKVYKRTTDRRGGRLGEKLEAQVQERPWRRAGKRKRQEVKERETREADAVIKKTRHTHRRIETSRHSERTLSVWQRMLDEGIT
jgi:hypothetical protein